MQTLPDLSTVIPTRYKPIAKAIIGGAIVLLFLAAQLTIIPSTEATRIGTLLVAVAVALGIWNTTNTDDDEQIALEVAAELDEQEPIPPPFEQLPPPSDPPGSAPEQPRGP